MDDLQNINIFFNSSQLADAAAVAVVFHNVSALQKILETGRCNTNIPTTLTGMLFLCDFWHYRPFRQCQVETLLCYIY